MLLAIDVGNSQAVMGCFNSNQLICQARLSTHPICTPDELLSKIQSLLSLSELTLKHFHSIVVASVVPKFTHVLKQSFAGHPLQIISHEWPFSFDIDTSFPEQIGADRLVNAEAAVRDYGAPCIIVDSGTATTLCALSSKKGGKPKYLGGAIFPGLDLSMQALTKNTALLFSVDLQPPSQAIGRTTQEALKSGLVLGQISMIEGMVRRFKQELGETELPVICTGGLARVFKHQWQQEGQQQGLFSEITHFDPNLTLKGIHYLSMAETWREYERVKEWTQAPISSSPTECSV